MTDKPHTYRIEARTYYQVPYEADLAMHIERLEDNGVLAEADALYDAVERGERLDGRPADDVIADARARFLPTDEVAS